jgi:hypothetical protein
MLSNRSYLASACWERPKRANSRMCWNQPPSWVVSPEISATIIDCLIRLLLQSRKFYCTVRLTVLEWGFVLLHRQAARGALTAGGWGYHLYLTAESTLPLSDGWVYPHPFWRLGVPSPFLTARCTLPISDGLVYHCTPFPEPSGH